MPSLSAALASAYLARLDARGERPPKWLSYVSHAVTERTPLVEVRGFKVKSYLVDYSARRRIAEAAIDYLEFASNHAEELAARINGKIVLIGDASSSQSQDTVSIPTETEPVPGIFAHACGAVTLAQSQISEFDHLLGLALTVALAFGCIFLVHTTCKRFWNYGEVSPVAMNILLTFALVAALLGITWSLARFFRVMWLDTFVICLILLIHCMTEVLLTGVNWHWLKTHRSKLVAALVVRPKAKEEP